MQPSKKIAIVTGGASGIGWAISQKLATDYFVIIIGRKEEKLQRAREQLGERCETISFDLAQLPGVPQLVEDIVDRHSRIDVLINNAGINMKKAFTAVSDDDFQQVLHTNINAMFALSREVVKQMLKDQIKGSIINISSMASQYGIPKVIAYTASKSAIEGMTRAMAVELSPQGIRVNCVAPGFIDTDMSAKALDSDPERKFKAMDRTPMGVLGKPADVAEAVAFLASDAAKFITGAVLPVDGGNSIGF